jgi:hypothetical protein
MHRLLFPAAAFASAVGICMPALAAAEWPGQKLQLQVQNPLAAPRADALVCVPLNQLREKGSEFAVFDGDGLLPSAPYDCDGDARVESLAVLADLAPKQSKSLQLYALQDGVRGSAAGSAPGAGRKTYAELAVRMNGVRDAEGKFQQGVLTPVSRLLLPPGHTVGNRLLKYEGPGWESELVGYRIYFDQRSAIDIFGKTKKQLVLSRVGLDGDDYHALSDWGMDVLKVGTSLGIGGVGLWDKNALEGVNVFADAEAQVRNSEVASGIDLHYRGWKTQSGERNLAMQLNILPGSRLTRVSVQADRSAPVWATGIVRHGLKVLTSVASEAENKTAGESGWQYLATWGRQSLADDELGMAIFFRGNELVETKNDANNHLALLRGGDSALYYLAAVWRDENIRSERDFIAYLESTLEELNHPIRVRLVP